MYTAPIDAYMLRRDALGALIAVPVRLTNTRPDSAPVAAEALSRKRITFVAPETLTGIVADDYPAHVTDLAATMQARLPHEIRISAAGIEARCLVEAA